jgi:hypothetical protein
MNIRRPALAVAAFLLVALPARADKYSVKTVSDTAPPKEVQEPIRKLLDSRCVQLLDDKGGTLLELWFRKEMPVKATEAQVKNGLTYAEVPLSAVVGVVRVPKVTLDYRKQKVKPGVYTLRLALQPMDGDHMGTAPYNEFCLLCPADEDRKPDLLEAKALHELSGKTVEGHPSVLVLFPGKGATAEPKLVDKGEGHWVLLFQLDAAAGPIKGKMDFGLTLVGVSSGA